MLIKSKLYNLEHGVLSMDKTREFGGTPVVKLGDQFKKVAVSGLFSFHTILDEPV
jgi:UTP--glucose-1-phosphate uridylyltransferase